MVDHNPPAPADRSRPSDSPPIAPYVSGELIFELYDGGQPCRSFPNPLGEARSGKEGDPRAGVGRE
jgi:hypothetical protein